MQQERTSTLSAGVTLLPNQTFKVGMWVEIIKSGEIGEIDSIRSNRNVEVLVGRCWREVGQHEIQQIHGVTHA